MSRAEQPSVTERAARGLLAGAVAGVAAAFAMDRFQALASSLSSDHDESEPATSRAADGVWRTITGADLPDPDKPLGGQAVHYALGLVLGAAYGVAAEFRPEVTTGFGVAFGVGSAALLDEAAVPAVGLGPAPWESPLSTHAYALASHLVFGTVAEGVRRSVATTLRPS